MNLPPPLTDQQKRDIVRLRKARVQWKVIARQVQCTTAQAIHAWKLATDRTYAARRRRRMAQNQRIRRAVKALGKTMRAVQFTEHGAETLGQRIKRLRTAKDWSGSHLAVRLGCSEPAVSYWENDLRSPLPQWRDALAQELGL